MEETADRQERIDPLSFYLDKSNPGPWRAVGALTTAVAADAEAAGLDPRLIELVNLRVSQINGCAYCLDVHTRRAVARGETAQRLGLLAAWKDAGVFDETEKVALCLAEAVTRPEAVEDRDAAQLLAHRRLTAQQYAAVQWLAIAMNTTNRISILSHHPVRRAPERTGEGRSA
ncbi:carboxymuconolactone decarboxylase family protein [Rothia kristinae]|uniref:carboxymuconolactone decarboxylase family protein n=1 Tax=Rothia kristinae TaxID=37923 RepID=UPI0011A794D1|nr:carboxymuconolactone decarboxylase family protein [Rothia kristinae]